MTLPSFVPVHAVRAQPLDVELAPTQRCPYCRDHVAPDMELVACGACQTVLHTECAKQGCTTHGCSAAPRLRFARPPRRRLPRRPRLRWARVAAALALVASGAGLMAWGQGVWRTPRNEADFVLPAPVPIVATVPRDSPAVFTTPARVEPLPPVAVPSPAITSLSPWRTSASEGIAFVRGTLSSASRVTLEGPDGESVSWEQDRGPFVGTVTLTGPGRHRVRVTILEQNGVETTHHLVVDAR